MLNQVRSALKGVVAWFFVVLLVLAFALWGVPQLTDFTRQAPLRVGDESYSLQALQTEFNNQVQSRRNETNGEFTRADAIAEGLPDFVISTMTTRSVLEQEAARMGLVAPRESVRDILQKDERFQNPSTGKFDRFVLQSILQNYNLTVKQFESRIRQDLLRGQIIDAASARAPAPQILANALMLRQSERRRVGYLIVSNEMAGEAVAPTPEDLQSYYEENAAMFTAPEYRSFTAVILREADVKEGLEVSEEKLKEVYDGNLKRLYAFPERRTIYQITFETEAGAQAAAAGLRQNKTFEDIALEQGLSLETQTFSEIQKSDVLDPVVGEAAFDPSVESGAIIDPIKGLFGWTVVQIASITPPETKSFEDVREEIESQLLAQDTRRRLYESVDVIENERDSGASLASAAQQAEIDVLTFGPVDSFSFSPEGAILDGLPGEVLTEAFRLDEGEESENLDLDTRDGYFFVSVDLITPPTLKPFEDVRDDVQNAWVAQERRNRISATVRSIRDAVEAGTSFSDAAAPYERAPLEVLLDRRSENEAISANLRDQVFSTELNKLVSGPAALGESQIIAEVREIGFARNEIGPGEIDLFRQFVGYQLDQELLEAYVSTLRDDYGVHIDQAQLDLVFSEGL